MSLLSEFFFLCVKGLHNYFTINNTLLIILSETMDTLVALQRIISDLSSVTYFSILFIN